MKQFTEEHEWIEVTDGQAVLGITRHAADELGDITFVELPEVGLELQQSDPIGVVESVKAAADVYSPCGGTVAEVNSQLEEKPELLNESPEDNAWICKLKDVNESDLDSLMDADAYAEFIAE